MAAPRPRSPPWAASRARRMTTAQLWARLLPVGRRRSIMAPANEQAWRAPPRQAPSRTPRDVSIYSGGRQTSSIRRMSVIAGTPRGGTRWRSGGAAAAAWMGGRGRAGQAYRTLTSATRARAPSLRTRTIDPPRSSTVLRGAVRREDGSESRLEFQVTCAAASSDAHDRAVEAHDTPRWSRRRRRPRATPRRRVAPACPRLEHLGVRAPRFPTTHFDPRAFRRDRGVGAAPSALARRRAPTTLEIDARCRRRGVGDRAGWTLRRGTTRSRCAPVGRGVGGGGATFIGARGRARAAGAAADRGAE